MLFKRCLVFWKIDLALIICLFVPLTSAFEYKPHSSCTFSSAVPNGKVEMKCPQLMNSNRYIWPNNFNASLLHPEITRLNIHNGVIMSDFVAIPPRDKLIGVSFQNFNRESGDMRFPLNTLLSNLKSAIEILHLDDVKLWFLATADLSGFQNLRQLKLYKCQIMSISKSAFHEVGIPIPGISPIQFTSQVIYIDLTRNKLETLDWSFLRPISRSVKRISFSSNQLRSENLTCSVPFTFQNVTYINLKDNQLRWIPADVFETFNRNLLIELHLKNNQFCYETSDCSCCEMWPFIKWMRQNSKISNIKDITCGTTNPNILPTMTTPDFQHCDKVSVIPGNNYEDATDSPIRHTSITSIIKPTYQGDKVSVIPGNDYEEAPDPPTRHTTATTEATYQGTVFTTRMRTITSTAFWNRKNETNSLPCHFGSTPTFRSTSGLLLTEHFKSFSTKSFTTCWKECENCRNDSGEDCKCTAVSFSNKSPFNHNCFLFQSHGRVQYHFNNLWHSRIRCCEGMEMEDDMFMSAEYDRFPRCFGRPNLIKASYKLFGVNETSQKAVTSNAEDCWKKCVYCENCGCKGVTFNNGITNGSPNCFNVASIRGGFETPNWTSILI